RRCRFRARIAARSSCPPEPLDPARWGDDGREECWLERSNEKRGADYWRIPKGIVARGNGPRHWRYSMGNGSPVTVLATAVGSFSSANSTGSYLAVVASDPTNKFCSGCLDFVYQSGGGRAPEGTL